MRRIIVSFNNAVRKIFQYNRWESVKIVLKRFNMAPIDLFLIRARLLLPFNCKLIERHIVKVFSKINVCKEEAIDECSEFGMSWHTRMKSQTVDGQCMLIEWNSVS